jgi:hypothetical protein
MSETAESFMEADFNHDDLDRKGLDADMQMVKDLFDEQDQAMLQTDIGNDLRLGNSKTVVKHIRQAAAQIRARLDELGMKQGLHENKFSPEFRNRLKSEAQTALKKALMDGRTEFIRRSKMSLPGY